jgi:serine/threonine protein kinase
VYRAKDTKLGREVAIKILPEEMAKRPDRMARFEREAKLLAHLDHPHIAAIHGLREEDQLLHNDKDFESIQRVRKLATLP